MPEVNDSPEVETPEQELADFNAGFQAEEPTETPVQTAAEPEAEPETPAAPEPKTKVITEDEWNELRNSAADIQATLEKRFGTAFGKIGGIERTIQQLQSAPAGSAPEISLDDLEALKDYGDELPTALAASLNKALAKVKVGGSTFNEASIAPIVEERVNARLEAIEKMRQAEAEEAVEAEHEDFRDVFKDPGFHAWKDALPEPRRNKLTETWNPAIITRAISDYKASKVQKAVPKQELQNNRRALLEASVAPKGTSAASPGKKSEMDEFMSGFLS